MDANNTNHNKYQVIQQLLWSMCEDGKGLVSKDHGTHADIVEQLRTLADVIEKTPHLVRGMVLAYGIEILRGGEIGTHVNSSIVGVTPAVAACFFELEDDRQQIMEAVKPMIMMKSMVGQIKDEEVFRA